MRDRRRALTRAEQSEAEQKLAERLSALPQIQRADTLALYLANDGELSPATFIDWAWQQGKSIALPVLHPFRKGYLLFLRYAPDTPMQRNKYGIPEPTLDVRRVMPASTLDLICTPLVAFDALGNRMGMGGGYYDRTLASLYRSNNPPGVLGLAHDCQQVDKLAVESWDMPLQGVITPTQNVMAMS